MAMNNCNNCLENHWSYQHIDGWIRATCQFCSHEVEFKTKKPKYKWSKNQPQYVWTTDEDGRMYRDGVEFVLKQNSKSVKLVPKRNV